MTEGVSGEVDEEAEILFSETFFSRREAQVYVLYHKQVLSHDEIGDVLGIERSTSHEYLSRALDKLDLCRRTLELTEDL